MTAKFLEGKTPAAIIRNNIKDIITQLESPPGLAVILAGDDPASQVYVKNKLNACKEVGIQSFAYNFDNNVTEEELLKLIKKLNNSTEVHGILVQLPLPLHINTQNIIESIDIYKDVDGFHPFNTGLLSQGTPLLTPCTPFGIMELLRYYEIDVAGMNAVIIGASNIVGKPLALELLRNKATVSICHKATSNLQKFVAMAEILIVATGQKDIIHPDWLHESQIIIDVGIHRNTDGTIRGDIDLNRAKEKVKFITPVPGGVGPMTVAALLLNTVLAYKLQTKNL